MADSNGDGHGTTGSGAAPRGEVGEWYGVRCLFHLDPGGLGAGAPDEEPVAMYEERITLWRAESFDDAIALAEAEAAQYAEVLGADYLGLAQAYLLADELGPGAEVFSLIRHSALDPEDYVSQFFDTGDEHEEE
jgi:hypothetical protein